MPRTNWFDDATNLPIVDEQVHKLEHFAQSMADGVVTRDELAMQQESLVEAMRDAEASLTDEQHAKVTRLLVELSAYDIMRLLHELQAKRLERFK